MYPKVLKGAVVKFLCRVILRVFNSAGMFSCIKVAPLQPAQLTSSFSPSSLGMAWMKYPALGLGLNLGRAFLAIGGSAMVPTSVKPPEIVHI